MGGCSSTMVEAPLSIHGAHTDSVRCCATTEDHTILATGSDDGVIRLWIIDLYNDDEDDSVCCGEMPGKENERKSNQKKKRSAPVYCMAIHDKYIISGSSDFIIRKWDLIKLECVTVYLGHTQTINRLLCNGEFIFSTSLDKSAKVWYMNTDKDSENYYKSYEDHKKGVFSIIFIPEDNYKDINLEDNEFDDLDVIITGSADCTARAWIAKSAVVKKVYKGHTKPVTCMTTSSDRGARYLYTGSEDGTIRNWNIASGVCLKVMDVHLNKKLQCLVMVNKLLYSADNKGSVCCWETNQNTVIMVYKGHNEAITSMKFNNGILYTGSSDGSAIAYHASSGYQVRKFEGKVETHGELLRLHESGVNWIAVSSNQRSSGKISKKVVEKLVTGGSDGYVAVWNLKGIYKDPNEEEEEETDEDEFEEDEVESSFDQRQMKTQRMVEKRLSSYHTDDVDLQSRMAR